MKAIRIKILILSVILLFISLPASAYQVVVMVEPAREVPIYKEVCTTKTVFVGYSANKPPYE